MKIVPQTSTGVENRALATKNGTNLHGAIDMRLPCPESRLDCPPISIVPLNLNCRDELIPILRALQHLYGDDPSRRELLRLVGKDVNHKTRSEEHTSELQSPMYL